MTNVYTKLNQAREVFHQKKLKKSGLNKFAGYQYFELADFIIPALQIFEEHRLCAFISFTKEYADMRIVDIDNPQDVITISSPMSEASLKGCHPVQNLGAVQTYLRRYLWVAALEIVEHDALDATTGKKGDAPVITPKGSTGENLPEDQKEFLREMAASCEELVRAGNAAGAYQMVLEAALEDDQQVWLWGLLDPSIRAAIKKAKEGK
jgi:hypothetical protein